MKSFLRIVACVVVVAGTSLGVQADSVSVQNGDFELPASSQMTNGWAYFFELGDLASAAVWTTSGGVALASDGKPWSAVTGSTGQFAFLQSNHSSTDGGGTASLTQTVSGFTVGNSYTISFSDSLLGFSANNPDLTNLSVYMDYGLGTQTLLYSTTSASRTAWTNITTNAFTAAKGSYALSFVSVDGGSLDGSQILCVDNVSITGSATPEPGTFALAVAGAFGLLAYAWRKRK